MTYEEYEVRLLVLRTFVSGNGDEVDEAINGLLDAAEAQYDEETQEHILNLAEKEMIGLLEDSFHGNAEYILHQFYTLLEEKTKDA